MRRGRCGGVVGDDGGKDARTSYGWKTVSGGYQP